MNRRTFLKDTALLGLSLSPTLDAIARSAYSRVVEQSSGLEALMPGEGEQFLGIYDTHSLGFGFAPAFSIDGKRIAFVGRNTKGHGLKIYIGDCSNLDWLNEPYP